MELTRSPNWPRTTQERLGSRSVDEVVGLEPRKVNPEGKVWDFCGF